MAKSPARDAEEFARLLFRTVERLGEDGDWVRARDAFDQTLAEHPDHVCVAEVRARPARRIALAAVAERLRAAEFPHIERRKAGTKRNAPVLYRIGRSEVRLDLQLPYEAAPSHPLLIQRRAAAADTGEPVSARRTAMTDPEPKSPWRRRLLRHWPRASSEVDLASRILRLWWRRLRATVSAIAAGAARR
jgi:hypothetical protein